MYSGTKPNHYNLRSFLKNNALFYVFYFALIAWASYYLLSYNKIDIHLKINALVGNPVFDFFYKYFTHLGDGVFAVMLAIYVSLYTLRGGIYVLITYIISGSISALLKNYFSTVNRPHLIFDEVVKIDIKYIDGVDILSSNSFPSGHSTTAFAVFTSLALLTENKLLKLIYLIVAANVAFSRTYISQHWLLDIYAGSLLGLISATALYFAFINSSAFSQKLNKPLFSFFK